MNEYIMKANAEVRRLASELSIASGLQFVTEGEPNDHESIRLYIDGVTIWANYQEYRMVWHFGLDTKPLRYISYDDQKEYKNNNPEPQKMHKINGRRILAWVDYLKKMYTALQEVSAKKVDRVNNLVSDARKHGLTVREIANHWDKNPTGAYSIRGEENGILYTAEIDNTGYICERLQLNYDVPSTIAGFKLLSNNGLAKV